MSNEATLVEIDPDGDVILEFTRSDGTTHLLVSSRVLSLASPVFARMFRSQFKEGLTRNQSSSGSLPIIPLPEDNEEAFKIICMAFHHRHTNQTSECLSAECLTNIATISDKWDFTTAMAHSAEFWLQRVNTSLSEDLIQYLLVAYILDAPHAFARLSWLVILNQAGPYSDQTGLSENYITLKSILGIFSTSQSLRMKHELTISSGAEGEESKCRNGLDQGC
jgi:hypothetical protein